MEYKNKKEADEICARLAELKPALLIIRNSSEVQIPSISRITSVSLVSYHNEKDGAYANMAKDFRMSVAAKMQEEIDSLEKDLLQL